MSNAPCVICASTKLSELAIAPHYTGGSPIHICDVCGLVQVVKRRNAQDLFQAWKSSRPGDPTYRSAYAAVDARHSYVASFVQTVWWPDRPNPILDVGAGREARFVKKLRKWWNWAAEPWDYMAEDLVDHKPFRRKFATITLNWVLENCADPNAVIRGCLSALAPDGKIVVATGSRILVPFKKPLWSYIGPGDQDLHAFRFSANTLRALLAKNGLKPIAINSFIDCDWLCVAATRGKADPAAFRDDPKEVQDYFRRWHEDTVKFYPKEAAA